MRNRCFASGDELKACRNAIGWTQHELSRRTGLHVQTVKYWEGKEGALGGYAPRKFRDAFASAGLQDLQSLKLLHKPAPDPEPESDRCGARTRAGTRCMAKALPGKGRCKFHGGHSTGPKTADGKARIAEAQRARWQAYHDEHAAA